VRLASAARACAELSARWAACPLPSSAPALAAAAAAAVSAASHRASAAASWEARAARSMDDALMSAADVLRAAAARSIIPAPQTPRKSHLISIIPALRC